MRYQHQDLDASRHLRRPLGIYVFLLPYETLESGYDPHLPKVNLTVGDLLSWACSSRLLHPDTIKHPVVVRVQVQQNPIQEKEEQQQPEEREPEGEQETELLAGSPPRRLSHRRQEQPREVVHGKPVCVSHSK